MDFPIVDLTLPAESDARELGSAVGQSGRTIGNMDTAGVALALEALRKDLEATVSETESSAGLRLTEVKVALTLTAEGRVAFVAKGSVEACIEVSFQRG